MSLHNALVLALVMTHVAAALAMGWISEDGMASPELALYVGLTFSQTSLLGLWGALGTNRSWVRLGGVAAGIAFLAPAFDWGLRDPRFDGGFYRVDLEIILLVALCTLTTAGVLLAVRLVAEVRRTGAAFSDADYNVGSREGLQFSIRHLIVLTFVVACLVTLGKWLRPHFDGSEEWAFLAALGLCFVAVGVASPWAMLGAARPLVRSAVVVGIAVAAAFVPTLLDNSWEISFWILLMVAEAVFLLSSLWVVRWCGFRLERMRRIKPGGPELSAHKSVQ